MIFALILVPLIAGLAAFGLRADVPRRVLLVSTALAHAALTVGGWVHGYGPSWGGWLALDAVGLLFLSIISVLFLATALYGVGWLALESHQHRSIPRSTCSSATSRRRSSRGVFCSSWRR